MLCADDVHEGGGGSLVALDGVFVEWVAELVVAFVIIALFPVAAPLDCAIAGVVDASASVVDVEVTTVRLVVASDKEGGEDDTSTWAAASRT